MYPTIFHVYGPLYITSYSIAIVIGLITFIWLATKDKRCQALISKEDFVNLTAESALAAILCARILHVLSDIKSYNNFIDIISIWNGGLSVLGALIGGIIYGTIYLKRKNISILVVLDIAAVYIPIIHAIARIGCFLVGCCHGIKSDNLWSITYTNPHVSAPLNIALHPTQLYSSAIFLIIFLLMRFILYKRDLKSGQLLIFYLILSSLERIGVDFFRGDRIFNSITNSLTGNLLSFHQIIALTIFTFGILGLFIIEVRSKKLNKYESI